MKTIFNTFLFLLIIFVFSACSDVTSPVENVTIDKGEYTGIFSVTFWHYQDYNSVVTQTGNISIAFEDTTYIYSGAVEYSSTLSSLDSIWDWGHYSIEADSIEMEDISWMLMNPLWQSSLYLKGSFNIKNNGTQIIISQSSSFADWEIVLIKK